MGTFIAPLGPRVKPSQCPEIQCLHTHLRLHMLGGEVAGSPARRLHGPQSIMRKRQYTALEEDADDMLKRRKMSFDALQDPEAAANEAIRFLSGLPPTDPELLAELDDSSHSHILCDPKAHNLVATSSVECSLGFIALEHVMIVLPASSFDRRRFAASTLRIATPACTTGLLFSSGKLVITGATSLFSAYLSAYSVADVLRKHIVGCNFSIRVISVQNLVSHASLAEGYKIDIFKLYQTHQSISTFQPSIFPGLVLRPPSSPVVLLLFSSGRAVITGGKSYKDVVVGFKRLRKILLEFIYHE